MTLLDCIPHAMFEKKTIMPFNLRKPNILNSKICYASASVGSTNQQRYIEHEDTDRQWMQTAVVKHVLDVFKTFAFSDAK